MANLTPDDLFYNKLATVFTSANVAPAGTVVYHESGDPVVPFCLYRRTNTSYERDLQNTAIAQVVTYDASIESMFYDQVAVVMPDSWTDSTTGTKWYFSLDAIETDQEDYRIVYSYTAAAAL